MPFLLDISDPPTAIEMAANLLTAAAILIGCIRAAYTVIKKRTFERQMDKAGFTMSAIKRALTCFVEPDCTSKDPADFPEPAENVGPREPSISYLDRFIDSGDYNQYLLLLADSGTGKTTLLLNYYYRTRQNYASSGRTVALIPLESQDAYDSIKRIEFPGSTILLLDAFDQYADARFTAGGHRLYNILELTKNFKKVIVTCRTQFFRSSAEIPNHSGVYSTGPLAAGSTGEAEVSEIFLSPFDHGQVKRYLRKKFPLWRLGRGGSRRKARKLIEKCPNLIVRPMLLGSISDLVSVERPIEYSFQIYESMIEKWLKREDRWAPGGKLYEFSKKLALSLARKLEEEGTDRIPRDQLDRLAQEWEIDLDQSVLSTRSLLNRDAAGNYKFSHYSLMEYLIAKSVVENGPGCCNTKLTHQTQLFVLEMYNERRRRDQSFSPDVGQLSLADLQPRLRNVGIDKLSRGYLAARIRLTGCFDQCYNKYSPGRLRLLSIRPGQQTLIDHVGSLMYQLPSIQVDVVTADIQRHAAKDASRDRLGNFSDWRLPTVEELLSMATPSTNGDNLFVDPLARNWGERVLSSDSQNENPWFVNFRLGGVFPVEENRGPWTIRLVRNGIA